MTVKPNSLSAKDAAYHLHGYTNAIAPRLRPMTPSWHDWESDPHCESVAAAATSVGMDVGNRTCTIEP